MVKNTFILALLLAFSCGPTKTEKELTNRVDSLAIRTHLHQLEILRLYSENDSLQNLALSIQQEQRITEYYLNQDFERLHSTMDSLARSSGEKGKGWRILGQIFGEAAKRVIPGL